MTGRHSFQRKLLRIRQSTEVEQKNPQTYARGLGDSAGVVVNNLPVAVDLAPHVGEASLDSLAGIIGTDHESVHTGVEVRVGSVGLEKNTIRG